MRTYEALIIFAETVKEDTVKEAKDAFQAEVERQDGAVLDQMMLGRRVFARTLKKRDSGLYGKVYFTMEPDKIAPLKKRCKFVDLLFRIQITVLPNGYRPPVAESNAATADEVKTEAELDVIAVAEPVNEEIPDGVNE